MKSIHISRISKVTDNEIIYLNENGEEEHIALAPCAENFDKVHSVINRNDNIRGVGTKLFCNHAYYEIYASEHIEFYLDLPVTNFKKIVGKMFNWNFYTKEFQLFYSLQKKLNRHNWTTMDLS